MSLIFQSRLSSLTSVTCREFSSPSSTIVQHKIQSWKRKRLQLNLNFANLLKPERWYQPVSMTFHDQLFLSVVFVWKWQLQLIKLMLTFHQLFNLFDQTQHLNSWYKLIGLEKLIMKLVVDLFLIFPDISIWWSVKKLTNLKPVPSSNSGCMNSQTSWMATR